MSEPEAPIRMVDDPDLGPELKDALEELSAQGSGFDAAAGLTRLQSAISAAQPPAAAAGGGTGALAVGAVLGVVALIGAGVFLARSGQNETRVPGETSTQPTRSTPSEVAVEPPAVEGVVPPEPSSSASAQLPESEPAAPAPARSGIRAEKVQTADPAQRRRDEVAHLAGVRGQSNCSAVVRSVDQGHQRFRGGVLHQEREFLAISCLARGGSSAARGRGRAFLRAFPTSPFAPQVRAAIGTK